MASKHKKGEIAYTFAAMPVDVLRSAEWQSLPPSAAKLAMDLVAQYTGGNNGRLCPAFEVMQHAGWASRTTLIAAKRALVECSFVVHTRQGKAPRTTDWIGFTWWKLNWEKSMDIEAKGWPHLNFMTVKPKDQGRSLAAPQKNTSRCPETGSIKPETGSRTYRNWIDGGFEHRSIDPETVRLPQ